MKRPKQGEAAHAIRISEEDWNRWKLHADKDRRSVAEWVSIVLTRMLDKKKELEDVKEIV